MKADQIAERNVLTEYWRRRALDAEQDLRDDQARIVAALGPKRLAYRSVAEAVEVLVARAPGEVETPCATCGGTGTDAAGISDAPCDICGGSGIAPDCGVETPEAAGALVVSRHQWVAVMDAAACEYGAGHGTGDCWRHRVAVAAAFDALIAQGWTPPGTEPK